MTRLDMYWRKFKEFWHRDNQGAVHIHDDAPEEVKKSYQRFCEQVKAAKKRGAL